MPQLNDCVIGRRNFLISLFLSQLKREYGGSFVGRDFSELESYFREASPEGKKCQGSFIRLTKKGRSCNVSTIYRKKSKERCRANSV